MKYTYKFGTTYNCGAYGAGSYNETNCQTNTGTNGNSGGLADTGYDIIIPVALAGALIIAGVILLVRKLLRKKK